MRALVLVSCALVIGCSVEARPTADPPPGSTTQEPPIDEAARKYPDFRALWERSIARTCGPNNGVCHQNRQFPHMELASSLYGLIGARCNQLRNIPTTVDNL